VLGLSAVALAVEAGLDETRAEELVQRLSAAAD
jgi:hypothetical protein